MTEISNALPVTPVTLRGADLRATRRAADRARDRRRDRPLSRDVARRVWLLREKTPARRSGAPRGRCSSCGISSSRPSDGAPISSKASGVPVIEEAWQWNPRETLLRDYYANSLLTFDEVKRRGWPERKKR